MTLGKDDILVVDFTLLECLVVGEESDFGFVRVGIMRIVCEKAAGTLRWS